jgi:KipI family sensor histidine kinase inhibitor
LTRVVAAGDAALLVNLGAVIDEDLSARVRALDAALASRPFAGFIESVPAHGVLLVLFDPSRVALHNARAAVEALASEALGAPPAGREHEIAVVYGGADGPDLEDVARATGLTPADVVARHAGHTYTALMLGFTPGFAYLGLVDERLDLPRRATPRTRVPAGSVAIAGRQTGIYPAPSAGGWHLIGRTAQRLFDPRRDPPVLVAPGDRVRFRAVDALAPVDTGTQGDEWRPSVPIAEVMEPGLLTTVQDLGRSGFRRYGVGASGALDRGALVEANRALGNAEGAAALECTLAGPVLRFLAPARFALAGADLGAVLERADLGAWAVPPGQSVQARPGNVLRFGARVRGCRAYLAFAGGLDVPVVLGSRSTDRLGGFGGHAGRPLRGGDTLGVGPARGQTAALAKGAWRGADEVEVQVVPGPQEDARALAELCATTWDIDAASDRVGLRLSGPRIERDGPAEIVSEGLLPGSIELPPDGRPIAMLRDAPTTGGYPKIATILSACLDALAQLVPGRGRVRFRLR